MEGWTVTILGTAAEVAAVVAAGGGEKDCCVHPRACCKEKIYCC